MFDPTKIAEALKQAQGMQSQFNDALRKKQLRVRQARAWLR